MAENYGKIHCCKLACFWFLKGQYPDNRAAQVEHEVNISGLRIAELEVLKHFFFSRFQDGEAHARP